MLTHRVRAPVGVDVRAQQMNSAALIPSKHNPPSPRKRVRWLVVGAIVGAVAGIVEWLVFDDPWWFAAIPVCAALGWSVPESIRPNVLWGHRGQ